MTLLSLRAGRLAVDLAPQAGGSNARFAVEGAGNDAGDLLRPASKAALESMIATYGLETAAISAIRTHVVDPGATRTVMRARAYPGEDPTRLKPPEEAARLILDRLG